MKLNLDETIPGVDGPLMDGNFLQCMSCEQIIKTCPHCKGRASDARPLNLKNLIANACIAYRSKNRAQISDLLTLTQSILGSSGEIEISEAQHDDLKQVINDNQLNWSDYLHQYVKKTLEF